MFAESLIEKSQEWVEAGIIDFELRNEILLFEQAQRLKFIRKFRIIGIGATFLTGILSAYFGYFVFIDTSFGFILELLAAALLSFGVLLGVTKKYISSQTFRVAIIVFCVGAIFRVPILFLLDHLQIYQSLFIWGSLILFSILLMRRMYFWLFLANVILGALYYAFKRFLDPNSSESDFWAVMILMVGVLPLIVFLKWYITLAARLLKTLFNFHFFTRLSRYLKRYMIRMIRLWRMYMRDFVEMILDWLGNFRVRTLQGVLGASILNLFRKAIPILEKYLWSDANVFTYLAVVFWVTLLSLIPKERSMFSQMFTVLGSIEIFIYISRFPSTGFRLTFEYTHFEMGRLFVASVILGGIAWVGKKLTEGRMPLHRLFALGPLGWITTAFLLALI